MDDLDASHAIRARARARVDLAAAAHDVRVAAVTALGAAPSTPGQVIEAARLTRLAATTLVTQAVLSERASGATWEQVATALNLPRDFVVEHYAPIEAAWLDGGDVLSVTVGG